MIVAYDPKEILFSFQGIKKSAHHDIKIRIKRCKDY